MAYTAADWVSTSDPKLASTYSDILVHIRRRDEDVARQFNDDDNTELASNWVTGTIRWDGTNKKWKIKTSTNANSWDDLVASGQYAIDVATVVGCSPNNNAGTNNLPRNNNALQSNLVAHYLGAANQGASFFRDAGNLNAGTVNDARLPASISSNITGNAATVTAAVDTSSTSAIFPLFSAAASGSVGTLTATGLTYKPSTGELTAVKFTGNGASLTGIGTDISNSIATKQATLVSIEDATDANGYGTRTVTTGNATGGSNGDIHYKY